MHTKTFLTTLLASQLAFAAVIPLVEREAGINPISGLPAPGSNLNPLSGLPTPLRRKPKHNHNHSHNHNHNHKIVGGGSRNPISGLPAPRVKLHGREAEPVAEAEAEPVRIVTNMHTSTKTVWVGDRPTPAPGHNGAHPKHPTQNVGKHPKQNGQGHKDKDGLGRRPTHGNVNPVNGLPAPGDPIYGKPHKGNGKRQHNGQGGKDKPHANRPHKGNGHEDKPKGIFIRPLTTIKVNGRPTAVAVAKAKTLSQGRPAPPRRTSHAPLITQTPTHVPQLQPNSTPKAKVKPVNKPDHDKGKHKGKDKSQGMIGKKPERRDLEYDDPETPTAETPEAYGAYAAKAEQLNAYDEGIAVTEADEDERDFYTGFSPYGDDEADGIFERGLDEENSEIDDEMFFETYEADRLWWGEFAKSQEGV